MLADVTNQYLAVGFGGGLVTMLLFILIIVLCFRAVGIAVRRTAGIESFSTRFCVWALGASLFAHALGFLSISYFDQNGVMWYLLLAMISASTGPYMLARGRSAVAIAQRLIGAECVLPDSLATQPTTKMSSSGS